MELHGTHTRLPDGSQLWRLAVRCRWCRWMAADLDGVRLRAGERLFVHGEGGFGARGAYTANGTVHTVRGTLTTPPLPGRLLTLESHAPASHAAPSVRVVRVLAGELPAFGDAASASAGRPAKGTSGVAAFSRWDAARPSTRAPRAQPASRASLARSRVGASGACSAEW